MTKQEREKYKAIIKSKEASLLIHIEEMDELRKENARLRQQIKNLTIPLVSNSVCSTCGKLNNPYCSNAWHLDPANFR